MGSEYRSRHQLKSAQKEIPEESSLRILDTFKKALKIAELYRVSGRFEDQALFNTLLEGGYVEPGASGTLTRGKVEILPTGRNFFATDPRAIPTKAAWEVGRKTCELMIRRIYDELGKYPETVGEVLWSIDAYKADGEQLAQILCLIGARPIWDEASGRVLGVELIPLKELGRPRIDVIVRISGIVRDTLPSYVYLIDEAIEKAILVNEPEDMNYVKKHYIKYLEKLAKMGMNPGEASELAKVRVWGGSPGTYGAGVNLAIFASAWRNEKDLAMTWVHWAAYAYTRRIWGIRSVQTLAEQLKSVEAIARHHISDEHDLTNCCCYFAFQGGFHVAAKTISGKEPINLWVDTRDAFRVSIRTTKEELIRVSYSKLLNTMWVEEMKRSGYRGAYEFMKKIQNLYGWHATTRFVPDEIWNNIAKKYVVELKDWFLENNRYALEEIARRLLEMHKRGLWKAPKELIEEIEKIHMEIEHLLEGEVSGEAQMSEVWVVTQDDIKEWSSKMDDVIKVFKEVESEKHE